MHPLRAFFEVASTTPAAQALALKLVTATDLLRLKAIARLYARGLPPDVDWCDLLQESFARMLDGSRRQPDGLPTVAFLAGVMRSLRAEHWRRHRRRAARWPMLLVELEAVDEPWGEPGDQQPDPERVLIATQEVAALELLFADDTPARQVIAGLLEGWSPEEIRSNYGLSKTVYDSTRRRMRRVLLREGLRSQQP